MVSIREDEKNIMTLVEDVVCSYFGVEAADVVSKDLTNNAVMARNYIFYILHHDYGLSVGKIAYEYFRQDRSVKAQLAKMRVCVRSNKVYKKTHSDIVEIIKGSGI